MPSNSGNSLATLLLERMRAGDESAAGDLLELVHGQLHGLAKGMMADERRDHTLQATALVNEAWIRLIGNRSSQIEDRPHFMRLAGQAMRRVLVDHARARKRLKRGGGRTQLSLDAAIHPDRDAWEEWEDTRIDVLELEETLTRLEAKDAELARIVELRFYSGLTLEETARAVGTTVEGVRWSWSLARAWLRREMGGTS